MKNRTYATSDFYLSAFLKARGFKLVNTERDGRRTTFIFQDREDREDVVREFYNGGKVDVNSFTHAIRDMRAVIFNL